MSQKRKFLEHYFRMYEMSDFDGSKHTIKQESDEMKRHLILANIPVNYYDYTIDHVMEKWSLDVANDESIENFSLYIDNLENACKQGTGLFFTGSHGLAKTTAAVVILIKALEQFYTSYFIAMSDLAEFVTSGWKDYNMKLKYQYIMTHVDFLVVDDIGRNYHLQKNQSTQFLDKLFVSRCNKKKSTILTCNHGMEANEIFSDSLLTLLKASLIELKLIGSDIREEKSKSLIQQLKQNNFTTGKKGKNG